MEGRPEGAPKRRGGGIDSPVIDAPYSRIRGRLSAWRRVGAPARVLQWLGHGVPLQWGQAGPPPPFDLGEYPLRTAEQRRGWEDLRREYLATGAIAPATPSSQSRISQAFLVEKGRDSAGQMKYRLCVDLRRINKRLRKVGLRYERLKDFGCLLSRGDSLVGFDIKNAYHHLRMCGDVEHFLQFRMDGEVFSCQALPFGLSLSPFYFTHLMLVIVRFLRSPGSCPKAQGRLRFGRLAGQDALAQYYTMYCQGAPATILAYLDDFLASMSDRDRLREWVTRVQGVFGCWELISRRASVSGIQCAVSAISGLSLIRNNANS